MTDDPADPVADDLAARLRDAHRRIASSELSQDERATAARRLIALSDTAKVDLASASQRLDRLLEDLDRGAATPGGAPGRPPTA